MLAKRNPAGTKIPSFVKNKEELIKQANLIKNIIKLNRLNIFKQKKDPTIKSQQLSKSAKQKIKLIKKLYNAKKKRELQIQMKVATLAISPKNAEELMEKPLNTSKVVLKPK